MRATVWMRRVAWGLAFVLAVAGCGGSKHGGTEPAGNALLFKYNAQFNGGRTVRWPSLPIPVSLGGIATAAEVAAWTGATGGAVTFAFVGSASGSTINFHGRSGVDICGVTDVFYENDVIVSADVQLSTAVFRGPQCVRTVTHETGHAIGFFNHTEDGGLMDPDGGNGQFTPEVTQTIRDLYALPPGTVVSAERPVVTELRSGGRRRLTFVYPVRR